MDEVERRTRRFKGGDGGGVAAGGAIAGGVAGGGIGPTGAILAARAGRLGATILGGASVIGAHRSFNRFYMGAIHRFSTEYQAATAQFDAEMLRLEQSVGESLGRALKFIPEWKTTIVKALNDFLGVPELGRIRDASGQAALSRYTAESQAAGMAAIRRRVL